MIEQIKINNYKSLRNIDLKLSKFCVFIGANGAGKTNFIDSLKFIRDSVVYDLNTAVRRRFGWKNILPRGIRSTEKIKFDLFCDLSKKFNSIVFRHSEGSPQKYHYALSVSSKKNMVQVSNENLESDWKIDNKIFQAGFKRTSKTVQLSPLPNIDFVKKKEKRRIKETMADNLFVDSGPFYSIAGSILSDLVKKWKFYNIDVNLAREPAFDEETKYLPEHGERLALVLDKLESDKNTKLRNRIKDLMCLLIPEFENWQTVRQMDSSVGFKIYEKGIKTAFLPRLISDGTIRLLSILVALLYEEEEYSFLAIEEPERCMHPQVLKTLVEIMRDISTSKQIIVSTHSREIVKWLKPEEMFLIDKKNNSTIVMPATSVNSINEFLENFEMDELWLTGYLEGGKIL